MKVYAVADLATEATQREISEHLRELCDSDTIRVVEFGWWQGDRELERHIVPSHLVYDVLPVVAGATHLTIEERRVP